MSDGSAHLRSARSLLAVVRQSTDAIGCAVSFGKDSLATLNLCCEMFPRVEAYYLFRVRGLRVVDDWARAVFERHGVRVRMYPHFDLVRCYRHALFQPHWRGLDRTPAVKFEEIESRFRREAQVDFVAMGWRRNDSFTRALIMRHCRGIDFDARRVFPLRSWRREQIYDYLRANGIPQPEQLGRREQGGLDFVPAALAWLREHYPDDWERWQVDFPFSEINQLRL